MSPFTVKDAPPNARLWEGGKPAARPGEAGKRLVCVYADGCRPEDVHIGGDDFGVLIPIADGAGPGDAIEIEFDPEEITIDLIRAGEIQVEVI